jgi:hypothetical protein
MILIEKEVNAVTGEETVIEREATAEEIAQIESARAESAALAAEAEARAEARKAVLDKLGLTADEATALLGL